MIRVKALRSIMAGATQKDFAKQHGLDASYLSQILNGHRNMGEKAAATLEEKIGLPSGTLVSPASESDVDQRVVTRSTAAEIVRQMLMKHGKNLTADAKARLLAAADETSIGTAASTITSGQVGDEISIAHYDVRAAMGSGQIPAEYPEMLQDVKVSLRHLRDMGLRFEEPWHLKMLTGWGQSMEPTIRDRDPLIVDVTVREFIGDGIYLLTWHDMLYVKRLQVADAEHYEMISDNAMHKDRTIRREEVHIQAKVLYVWNGHLL
ncbi:LexA family transcriptional regulator [uncultured Pseudomonas sp.]|uniref:XRE family transcriptional regulator n=1 Tax=uncultured Pseudomonas sp. TaxID=114707 RepID=UPI0025D3C17E|nr:LexA family transcriptional regulator [uncultured Pseudomonas sp.]